MYDSAVMLMLNLLYVQRKVRHKYLKENEMNTSGLVLNIEIKKQPDCELIAKLTVHNNLQQEIDNWNLQFDLPKSISAGFNTYLVSHIGSHVTLKPADNSIIKPGQSVVLEFLGLAAIIQRISDLPSGCYVRSSEELLDVTIGTYHIDNQEDEHSLQPYANQTYIDWPVQPNSFIDQSITSTDNGIVPRPASANFQSDNFILPARLHYSVCSSAIDAVTWLSNMVPSEIELVANNSTVNLQMLENDDIPADGYRIDVNADKVSVEASTAAGFINASASLLQLLSVNLDNNFYLPQGCIEDQPRFQYRGLMLDCARHFQDKKTILKTLDLMVLYKFNHFHWHLTDDEGWRVEILAFPALTEQGAWRGDGEVLEPQFGSGFRRYGGFYSQDDIREIIAYASLRHITVIPEIDIPGHSRAAIKSLPELLVEPEDKSSYCSAQLYNDNVLNPAIPGTYYFLDTVMDEICELFPGPYVHIGADEVPLNVWEKSPACHKLMQEHGYQTCHELQGHLLHYVQKYLANKGKQLIGWEEAVHGDKLDKSALFCAWSSITAGINMANDGFQTIACPAPYAYLDLAWDSNMDEPGYYWAGTANLELVYSYEPCSNDLNAIGNQNLIGVQALAWSEQLYRQEQLDYMMFPRLLALSEIAWSPKESKNWNNFIKRLPHQDNLLIRFGVNCHKDKMLESTRANR